ncbi:MAG: AraC family transcriptional regulator [Winogradskyella sp.]|uniref:AraC family transcriptional regulator n=1 Tax=Winogradskyella sp. TaxID=1883156 RepID=UPI000F40E4B2|nr:AraC family transcriptional regulator [Winogradskyella sp.]RNC87734.1 MAG: AraC family transcriptional regulator [Winogradskyella sp.]
MKPLEINEFKGYKTVNYNEKLKVNRAFFSSVKDFNGKLSESHFSLKFPITGVENYSVDNKRYKLDKLSYIVTNASQHITADVKSKNPVLGICIGFSEEFMFNLAGSYNQKLEEGLENPFNNKTPISFITKKSRICNDKLSSIVSAIKNDVLCNNIKDNYEEEQFYITLGELLIEQQQKIYSDIKRLPQAKFSTREEIYRRVSVINDFICDNYKNDISIEQLSRLSALSKYHAIRCYQKINKISPYQKIQKLRLEEAKQLILSGMSVAEAANEVNFTDYRTLSKLFKKHYGLTPSELKNIHKQ